MARAIWNGQIIAESSDTVVIEGNHYFPQESLNKEHFEESSTTSVCGWKGTANYFNVVVDGQTNRDAAWYYATPKEAAKEIAGRVAFWKGIEVSAEPTDVDSTPEGAAC